MKNEKWDARFLDLAQLVSTWSRDNSTKVGAVITDPANRVVSMGYNGFARGVRDTPERLADRDFKYPLTIHAEENAILFAERNLAGCTLYTWPFMPCGSCAAKVIQVGIHRVVSVVSDNPRWVQSFQLAQQQFSEAGVVVEFLNSPSPTGSVANPPPP